MAQPIQPVDRLCSSDRGPVEGGQKVSLSPSGLLFPVKVEPQPVEVRSRLNLNRLRSDRGPVEDKVIKYREKLLTQLIMSPENEVRENVYQAMDQ
ncbi:hypothetical protein CK203_103478 [Vitis vinifera]|uniref:Uncharacterized protein n=1 Tax=Vitis vinifera TaxID=29760 RepID=A0A438DJL1_VITVI|nr:hypothetical protein CK203_103478 [Vitis vinifera]